VPAHAAPHALAMSLFKLSEVEAFRAQVLLEEALKKLDFLADISHLASVHHGEELTQYMGEQISQIIQEQRDLERRYEELIAKRGQLKGLCNKEEFTHTHKEIQEVASKLRESNKTLCRSLRENPNVQGNIDKMKDERQRVQEWLRNTKKELMKDFSFANLVQKVEEERHEQEHLSDVKRKEREVSLIVKQREAELARERADNEKETKQANQEIKELKEELHKNRTISEIEFKFEEKKLRAQEQALLRIHAQMEKKLLEELEQLRGAQDLEQIVHEQAQTFLEEKLEEKQKEKEKWQSEYEREVNDREVELTLLKERRATAYLELKELDDKRNAEAEEYRLKENEMRNNVLVAKQKRDQELRMQEAVLFLQEEGRRYMQRMAARRAAMKGKKKKKGKKK